MQLCSTNCHEESTKLKAPLYGTLHALSSHELFRQHADMSTGTSTLCASLNAEYEEKIMNILQ